LYFKKCAVVVIFLSAVLLCSGCETAKGIGRGFAAIGDGVGKDLVGAGSSIKKADDWFRENLW